MRTLAFAACGVALASSGAEAHQCYARVVDPPRYSQVAEEIMVSPAREVEEFTPAVMRTVAETVVVRPERTVVREIPARYGVEAETVEVSPAHREWRVRNEDGEFIGCWVDVPARYGRLAARVMLEPPREVTETVPAETATRERTEVVEPARTTLRTIPARYAARTRLVLASPGGARWAPIAACER